MGIASLVLISVVPTLGGMASESSGRYQCLDALRGLLAACVLVHHAYIARLYFGGAEWVEPAAPLYRFLGSGAVAVFFMITGLLFWGKVLDGRLQLATLLRSRARRIMPLYLFSVTLMFAIVLARTGFELQVPAWTLTVSLLRWLAGGLLGSPPINGVSTTPLNAGVTWTLQYEWIFYLSLPMLTRLRSRNQLAGLALGYLLLVVVLRLFEQWSAWRTVLTAMPFGAGMLAAQVVRSRARLFDARQAWVSCFVLGSTVGVVASYVPGRGTALLLALVPAFIAVALGNDMFGLLRWRPMRWLGHVSFSVYLLHGLVLLGGLSLLDARWPIEQWSDGLYVAVCGAFAALVVVVSSVTYLWIERSFMAQAPRPADAVPSMT